MGSAGTAFPHLEETVVATARYLEALTGLTDEDVRRPSLLPGWTLGHVITHVSRNADALANLLHGAEHGEQRSMYSSQEQRDADVEAGAGRPAAELVADAVASAGRWVQAANELHVRNLEAPASRVPGSEPWPVRRVGVMRRTEVEVHHADLGIGYTARDWPADLLEHLMHRRERELRAAGVAMSLRATDSGGAWSTGEGPEVSGEVADLVWWLLGRGTGERLVCSGGELPELGRWA